MSISFGKQSSLSYNHKSLVAFFIFFFVFQKKTVPLRSEFLILYTMNILNVLLQAAPGTGGEGAGQFSFLIMIVVLGVIMYFFMIRPQQKRQKDIQRAREAMKVGDKVVIAGGIHGRIKEIAETTMIIEISEGVRVRVDKASVYASSEDIQAK